MTIHHIRNATMIIESEGHVVLIDPMIGAKGEAAPPFAVIRSKPRKNPIVDLPEGALDLVNRTTHCLITHQHADHLDKAGIAFLKEKQIPVTCSQLDEEAFISKGLNVSGSLDYWEEAPFLEGSITGTPCRHGYGYVAKPMGPVMGFFIKLPEAPSVYLSSDTIYTEDVEKVLTEFQPDISVVACGTARLDVYQPLLMKLEDIIRFVHTAPHEVICNHMEAVNHCHTNRKMLTNALKEAELLHKSWIPNDGASKTY